MSCEARHHDIVARLLTLAGLHGTDADTVMGVGVANRRRRGGLPTTAAATVPLHPDARDALEITGHSDHATPSWVSSLIDRLHLAANHGNRRALLTMRWLTEGWDAITSRLTWSDRRWIQAVNDVGIPTPSAWEAWLPSNLTATNIGSLLLFPVDSVVRSAAILDALSGIDTIHPESVQTTSPLQVLRLLIGGSFPSRADLRRVLRAILHDEPVVRRIVTWLNGIGWSPDSSLPTVLIGRAVPAHGRSVEQTGGDAVLELLAGWIWDAHGPSIDPAALREPSPMVVETVTRLLRDEWNGYARLAGLTLTALLHIWRLNGQDDAVEDVVRGLGQVLPTCQDRRFVFSMTVLPTIVGIIHPPHGDALVAHLGTVAPDNQWSVLAAGAVYAAMCRQIGHVPTVDGIESLIHDRWGRNRSTDTPSPLPVLTIGREQELLLPALAAARGTERWVPMILDCIDTLDILDSIGGDPQGMLAVLADVLAMGGGTLDPQIVIRLAASRCGQAILPYLPAAALPPMWDGEAMDRNVRVLYHLISPGWATAPPHLRAWWGTAFRRVARTGFANLLNKLLPLYPTVLPQAAVMYPHPNLIARAVAHRQWATIPDADRRACLDTALPTMRLDDLLRVVGHAATATALRDIGAAVAAAGCLSDTDKGYMRQLIDPDAWGGQHEL